MELCNRSAISDSRLKTLNTVYDYENLTMQYNENFVVEKMKIFTGKMIFFLIFAQNIDCGYTLKPPHRGPCMPQFCYLKHTDMFS